MQFLIKHWDVIKDILGLIVIPLVAILVSSGFLKRRNRALRDLLYIEQQFEAFKKTADATEKRLKSEIAAANSRLNRIDPDRFITQTRSLTDAAKFAEAEKLAIDFTSEQTPAFGLAAELLAEQSILASGEFGKSANDDALRFLTIGLAANPSSVRMRELRKLAQNRAQAIERGEPIETLNWDGLSDVDLNRLAHSLRRDGKYQLAEIAARRSVPLALLRTGKNSENFAAAMSTHGISLRDLGAFIEAEGIHVQAIGIIAATVGTVHPTYANGLNNLAVAIEAQGRHAEAEELIRQATEIAAATIGTAHPDYAAHLNNLANVVQAQGRSDEGEGLYQQALDIGAATLGTAHPDYAIRLNNLAALAQANGRYAEAEGLYKQALEIDAATIGTAHPVYATHLNNLAGVVQVQGRYAEAASPFRQALAVFRDKLGDKHPYTAGTAQHLLTLLQTHFPDDPEIPAIQALLAPNP